MITMSGQNITRKLKAILSADVKGYSLLMADNEVLTLKTLNEHRKIMSDLIESHSGRVVDAVGDNMLAEFSSAVDAVDCAVKIQKSLKKENAKFIENRKLQFRIGINIGDVIHEGDRIIGEGVNIAARIESIAETGGVCISRNTYDQIKNKLQVETEYLGAHKVKNIKEPVRVYKILLDSDAPKRLVEEELKLPNKPSIAVLPFSNMSGDPDQDYFSDGLTEQIINGLCKISSLFVIARNSSFAYKGKHLSIKQVAQDLGVKYILEGSVQKAGDRVRITAQLIDALTDFHMWSENYDRDLEDIFALQDEITMKVISAMEVNLTQGEQANLWEGYISNIQSYDKFTRGLERFNQFNKNNNLQARKYFQQASVQDKSSALIYAWIGYTYLFDFYYNWGNTPQESLLNLEHNAEIALSLDESLDLPHMIMAHVKALKEDYVKAIEEGMVAVRINPNGAVAFSNLAFILSICDEVEKSIIYSKKAIRLNPIPPSYSYFVLGIAYTMINDLKNAIETLKHCISIEPNDFNPYLPLTACYIALGKTTKAKDTVNSILEITPSFKIRHLDETFPMKNKGLKNLYIANLRKAGLPY
jgi:adenylate cyclase